MSQMHACGYVALKLLRKYERKSGEKFDQFEMCLGEMAVLGEPTDFTQYTTEWIDKVNGGGLFPLNDESFQFFFCTVEVVVRTVLPRVVVSKESTSNRKTIVDAVDNMKMYWSLVYQDIDEEEWSSELLSEAIELWVTIQGFSLVSHWLEAYKLTKKNYLRKALVSERH